MRNMSSYPIAWHGKKGKAVLLNMTMPLLIALFSLLCILGSPCHLEAKVLATHLDRAILPQGCLSCHAGGHGAKKTAQLKGETSDVCLRCHDARSAEKNINITLRDDIRGVLNKPSHHPIEETAGEHGKGENAPGSNMQTRRHVACGDCHDSHWSVPDKPFAKVDGINSFGVRVVEAAAEYELCYKCHADAANLPVREKNKRLEFNRNNPSSHPVEARGKNLRVPSLLAPLSTSSTIACSDCHNNNDPLGPQGPHGSTYPGLLALNYETQDGLQESSFQYALCYKCHSRENLLRDQSFPLHNLHIVKAKTSCFTCHNSHGSQTNTHLIHFNPNVVGLPVKQSAIPFPQPGAQLKFSALPLLGQPTVGGAGIDFGRYIDQGNGHGQCFLSCHGKLHDPASY